MICFYEIWSVHLVSWFPCVVCFGVAFPLDQVLELSRPSMMSMAADLLHLIFFFAVNEFRGWSDEVGAVLRSFLVWVQQ